MADRNYLLRVLGLSAVPRVFTFGLTLVSLPLLVRALGADEYGIFIYLQSFAAFFELFAGFGVAAAMGRGIAACRAERPHRLRYEVARWSRFQGIATVLSSGPVLIIGYWVVVNSESAEIEPAIFFVVVAAMYVATAVTFMRYVLQSLLSFRMLAALDVGESVSRSGSWLVVAWQFPHALGLAVATLISSSLAAIVGVFLVRHSLKTVTHAVEGSAGGDGDRSSYRRMFRESLSFMSLQFGTRAYNTLPGILFGKFLSFEVAGIFGAFMRIAEMLALPFTVIGNALMVRAQEVKAGGLAIARKYWDMLLRFVVIALGGVLGFWFAAGEVAHVLFQGDSRAALLFAVMTPLIFIRAASDLFAPAADYVGGLRSRVVFLLACAVAQGPLIWVMAVVAGDVGAVLAVVVSQSIMVIGYVIIAKRVFFGPTAYQPPSDFAVAVLALSAAVGLTSLIAEDDRVALVVYVTLVATAFFGVPKLRHQYGTGRFLRFDLI